MALVPHSFIDDLRARADIVAVVQDYVPLKKSGATWKGLCPFHGEKTPSFHVNPDKGFFYCFGCQTGGDVFKFVELQEKVGFQDAVRLIAHKFGMTVPEAAGADESDSVERETLLKIQEVAATRFREQLASRGGRHRAAAIGGARDRPGDDRAARARVRAPLARGAEDGARQAGVRPPAARQERPGRAARGRADGRSVPRAADDSRSAATADRSSPSAAVRWRRTSSRST